MPTPVTKIVEWRTIWDTWHCRQWERHFLIGSIGSGEADLELLEDLYESTQGILDYWDLYVSAKTVASTVNRLTFQIVSPNRSAKLDLLRQTPGLQGRLVCGTQPWHATYRINWFSDLWNHRPHWWEISPVPRFDQLLSPDKGAYLRKLEELSQWLTSGWSTLAGDTWRVCFRQKDGTFHPATSFKVTEFSGRQKTRRRVL